MEPVLVDTSVWIDWFGTKNNDTDQTTVLEACFRARIPVYSTAVILQEVLQGVRQEHMYQTIKETLLGIAVLRLDPVEAAIGAADLYRSLRRKGITIRKPNDCLIAHYAIFYDIPILHNDVDFDQIARHTALRLVV